MLEINFINFLPPIFSAMISIFIVLIWQLSGSLLLRKLVLCVNPKPSSMLNLWCWLMFPVLAGSYQLALEFLPRTFPIPLLRTLPNMFLLSFLIFDAKDIKATVYGFFTTKYCIQSKFTSFEKIVFFFTLALFSSHTLLSAHPQWMYDQLAYHLVIPNLIVYNLPLKTFIIDSHLALTGPLEWGFSNLGLMIKNQHLLIGSSQFYTWLLNSTGIFALLMIGTKRKVKTFTQIFLVALLTLTILTCFPEPDLKFLTKPDFLVAIMCLWCILALARTSLRSLGSIFAMAFSALSLKSSALLPAGIILVFAMFILVNSKFTKRNLFIVVSIALSGFVPLLLFCIYRVQLGASPFFPVDRKVIESLYSNINALNYWATIGGETNNHWWLSMLLIIKNICTSPLFLTLIIVSAIQRVLLKKSDVMSVSKTSKYLAIFAAVFFTLGCIVVNATSSYRFFASGYLAVALLIAIYLLDNLHPILEKIIFVALLIPICISSQTDVAIIRILRFNATTLEESMAEQIPMFRPSQILNNLQITGLVPSNDQTKYYLNLPVLTHTLSPAEIAFWEDIKLHLADHKIPNYINAIIEVADVKPTTCQKADCTHEAQYGMSVIYPKLIARAKAEFTIIVHEKYNIYLRK